MAKSDSRLSGLDALRGIAALLVALGHLDALAGEASVIRRSWLAVDFFFLLSGFVMTRTYEGGFAQGKSPLSFLTMRFRRLWKPMAVGTALGAAFFLYSGALPADVLPIAAFSLLMMPIGGVFILNNPGWSVFFELFANLVHAAVLHRLSVALLGAVIAASAAALILHDPFTIGTGQDAMFWWGIPRVMLSYCAGILLCRVREKLALPPFWAGAILLPFGICAATIVNSSWFDLAFVLLASPFCVLAGLNLAQNSRVVPMARWLGAMSFPLYAVHYPAFRIVLALDGGKLAAFCFGLMVALVATITLEKRGHPRRAGTLQAQAINPA